MRALGFVSASAVFICLAACSSDSGPGAPSAGAGGNAGAAAGAPSAGGGMTAAGAPSAGAPAAGSPAGGASGGGQAGGSAGTGGSAAGTGGSGGASSGSGGALPFVEPTKLSQTGLYTDIAKGTLAPGVLEYQPKFELWSDGAAKKRWVYLPPGSKIDTSSTARSAPMDFWVYPVGTKLWKEFSRDGVRVETRLIEKHLDDRMRERWFMTAFVWNAAGTDADASVDGVPNAKGTPHDVPSRTLCGECHDNVFDRVLGFSAIQLSHDLPGVKLSQLVAENRLTAAPAAPLALPGTAAQQTALGYMHANCGHCHNENSQHASLGLYLWLSAGSLGSVQMTPSFMTTVGVAAAGPSQPDADLRIVPRNVMGSELYQRMTMYPAGNDLHMPRVAAELNDPAGVAAIEAFIQSLPAAN